MIEHAAPAAASPPSRKTLHETGAAQVRATYEQVGGNISETSRRLGISRNTVYRLLKRRRADPAELAGLPRAPRSVERRMDLRFCVAPMMDWTDRHCRAFHRTLSRRARLYTEMVTTGAVLHGRPSLIAFDAAEHPVAVQARRQSSGRTRARGENLRRARL